MGRVMLLRPGLQGYPSNPYGMAAFSFIIGFLNENDISNASPNAIWVLPAFVHHMGHPLELLDYPS
jgi:hypothetical protein